MILPSAYSQLLRGRPGTAAGAPRLQFYRVLVAGAFSHTCVLLYPALVPARRAHAIPDPTIAPRRSHYVV